MSTKYLRDKFADLRLHSEASTPNKSLRGRLIFSPEEISKEPLKWLKYIVMDRVGLESIGKISAQINRFSLSEVEKAKAWVQSRFTNNPRPDVQQLVVAKVVPWDSGAQLKNYRIFTASEVEETFKTILNDFPDALHELWCCESSVSNKGLNLGGRLNYPRYGREQVLELVWFASPRFIESIRLPEFSYPYLRAVRSAINPTFNIDILHVPQPYSSDYPDNIWTDDFRFVARELQLKQPAMYTLVNTVKLLGAKEVCFCFKMMEERLTVIDWDSEVESTDS
jgi:hypothetical protein